MKKFLKLGITQIIILKLLLKEMKIFIIIILRKIQFL